MSGSVGDWKSGRAGERERGRAGDSAVSAPVLPFSHSSSPPFPHSPIPRPKVWLLAARPRTLPAALAPVLLGIALAVEAGASHGWAALCALLGALLIQIGTNFANDYQDFLKGADTEERKGPLRVTQAGLVSPEAVKRATVVAFALAVAAGTYLMIRGGWPIVAIGALSILCGVLYTGGRYSLAYLGIADLFVLVFFGPVAVAGTFYVQAVGDAAALGRLPEAIVAGLGPGLLAVAILLANNVRDVREDRAANKRTLVVRLGRSFGVGLYAFCFLAAAAVPVALWLWTGAHPWAMLAALVLPLGLRNARTLHETEDYARIGPVLGKTGQLLLAYSLLFAAGWMAG